MNARLLTELPRTAAPIGSTSAVSASTLTSRTMPVRLVSVSLVGLIPGNSDTIQPFVRHTLSTGENAVVVVGQKADGPNTVKTVLWTFGVGLAYSQSETDSMIAYSVPLPADMWIAPGETLQIGAEGFGSTSQISSCVVRYLAAP